MLQIELTPLCLKKQKKTISMLIYLILYLGVFTVEKNNEKIVNCRSSTLFKIAYLKKLYTVYQYMYIIYSL